MVGSILSLSPQAYENCGKGLCVSLRSLRSLRLGKHLMANEVADQDADLLFGETQRNAKRVGRVRWREEVE